MRVGSAQSVYIKRKYVIGGVGIVVVVDVIVVDVRRVLFTSD